MRILIVDDEQMFVELFARTLASIGYEDIESANSGEEALARIEAQSTPFDCFLLDIRMDGMDGIELCKRIRALPQHHQTPIVMVTTMTEKSYVDSAFHAGANDYLTKPIDKIEITARMGMVEALLSERQHSGLLVEQLSDSEHSFGAKVRFEDPVALPDTPEVVPLGTLENYVLRLGNLRLFSSMAVGFHVTNAADIYARTGRLDFVDILANVAAAIGEALRGNDYFLAYAGSGDFCCVMPRLSSFDRGEAEVLLNDRLARIMESQAFPDCVTPRVRIGAPATSGLLSFNDPTHLLYKAIGAARKAADTAAAQPHEATGAA